MINWLADVIPAVAADVATTLAHTWPFLGISIVAAAAVTTYVGADRVSLMLRRRTWVAIGGAVLFATLTPFCSCGTTAVVLGGLATAAPWAPLVAFIVASPLTSPSELLFSAGLFGWPFAVTFFIGTIGLGLAAGATTAAIERRGWLRDQARVASTSSCSTCTVPPEPVSGSRLVGVGPGTASTAEFSGRRRDWRLDEFGREIVSIGRRLLLFFFAFTTIGYVAIETIPTQWLTEYLGSDSLLAVPLGAVVGIPAYLNTEASLPLVAALTGGSGSGAALAFLVTGAGTSIGAISGLFVIARRRVVALVVALLFAGALAIGWTGQLIL